MFLEWLISPVCQCYNALMYAVVNYLERVTCILCVVVTTSDRSQHMTSVVVQCNNLSPDRRFSIAISVQWFFQLIASSGCILPAFSYGTNNCGCDTWTRFTVICPAPLKRVAVQLYRRPLSCEQNESCAGIFQMAYVLLVYALLHHDRDVIACFS